MSIFRGLQAAYPGQFASPPCEYVFVLSPAPGRSAAPWNCHPLGGVLRLLLASRAWPQSLYIQRLHASEEMSTLCQVNHTCCCMGLSFLYQWASCEQSLGLKEQLVLTRSRLRPVGLHDLYNLGMH